MAKKRETSLHLLPQGMARHTLNTSRTVWNRDLSVPCSDGACSEYLVLMCRKQWRVEWRVRLVFPQAALEYSEERCTE